jgi:hypothetical protein
MSDPLTTDPGRNLPWRYERERDNVSDSADDMALASSAGSIMDADDMHIARVWLCGPRPRMDGSLLAAAPDLLAALCALLPMVEEWHAEFPRDVGDKEAPAIAAARAAIAKATGERS